MNAQSTGTAPVLFSSALLLAQSDAQCVVDRRALRDLGIRNIRILTSGIETARMLADFMPTLMPDVIFCHERLADMDGESFVRLIRSHPRLVVFPIVGLISNHDPLQKQRALEAGYSTVLSRPYAVNDLYTQLLHIQTNYHEHRDLMTALQSMESLAFDEAIEYYSGLCTNNPLDAAEAFYQGLRLLKDHQWDEAIPSFQKAMNSARMRGEAQLGLAFAWKGKGDLEKCRAYLREACTTFIKARTWHRAKSVYMRLLREAPQGINPLLVEAEIFIRSGDYDSAAQTLLMGYDTQQDTQLYTHMAKACLFTDDPQESANRLCDALYSLDATLPENIPQNLDSAIRNHAQQLDIRNAKKKMPEELDDTCAPVSSCEPLQAALLKQQGLLADNVPSEKILKTETKNRDSASPEPKSKKNTAYGTWGESTPLKDEETLPLLPDADQKIQLPAFITKFPMLRDVISVASMTWKLSRKKK